MEIYSKSMENPRKKLNTNGNAWKTHGKHQKKTMETPDNPLENL